MLGEAFATRTRGAIASAIAASTLGCGSGESPGESGRTEATFSSSQVQVRSAPEVRDASGRLISATWAATAHLSKVDRSDGAVSGAVGIELISPAGDRLLIEHAPHEKIPAEFASFDRADAGAFTTTRPLGRVFVGARDRVLGEHEAARGKVRVSGLDISVHDHATAFLDEQIVFDGFELTWPGGAWRVAGELDVRAERVRK